MGVNASTNATNTAGVKTSFDIQSYNAYNISIPVCPANATLWAVQFVPSTNTTYTIGSCDRGHTTVHYTTTRAGLMSLHVLYNDTPIFGSPYQAYIRPNIIDPAMTTVFGIQNGPANGTFYLQARDRYGNNETSDVGTGNFHVSLSPNCAHANVSIHAIGNGIIECVYTVGIGGLYCAQVDYGPISVPLQNSSFYVFGGLYCENSCNDQGFCLATLSPSTSDGEYSCSCFQGYMNDDCSDETDDYPLTVGAIVGLVMGIALALFLVGLALGYFLPRMLKNRGVEGAPLLD